MRESCKVVAWRVGGQRSGLTASDRQGLALSALSSSARVCAWLISRARVSRVESDSSADFVALGRPTSTSTSTRTRADRTERTTSEMVLTRSDSATSVWVLPPPPPPHFDPLAPGPDGNYTLPDSVSRPADTRQ